MRFASRSSASDDRVGEGVLEVGDPVDDRPDAMEVARAAADRLLLPVAPDPAAQALRLADVEDVAAGVLHQVDARAVRELAQGRLAAAGSRPRC